uniref:Uncharacterized protein n=1 Tax=viral metagenome TaxID=1070528 RepID=A0A6M3K324_9ZZZZ
MKKVAEKKEPRKPAPGIPIENKILKELVLMNDTLNGMKNILDSMWRERKPE